MSFQDSGGYDDTKIEVKFQQAVENLTKKLGENERLTKNQLVQVRKIIVQHEKKYNSDKDHWAWKDRDRQKQRKFALEKIEFQGKQVRLNKQLASITRQQIQSYDYVKQSLTGGGRSLKSAIGGVSDHFFYLTKNTRDLRKAQDDLNKAKQKGDTKDINAAQTLVDELQRKIGLMSGNNPIMKAIVSRLEGIGEILERNQGKVMIGAGVASVLIGIISKALNVAPLFQAMMKLMQFAVTMILMPIGTFFGAVLRPIVIGLVKGIAPQFKDWMKNAMKLGNDLGKFIMEFLKNPAAAMGGLFKDAILGDTSSQMGTVATLAGAGTATAVATKILPKVLGIGTSAAAKTGGTITFGTLADDAAKTGSKVAPKLITTLGKLFTPKLAETIGKGLSKSASQKLLTLGGSKLLTRGIPIAGWALAGLDVAGSAMKQFAPDQYEGVRQGALGVGKFFGDDKGTHTEGLLDFLGFGQQSTFEMLGEGFKELEEVFKGGSTETIAESAEKSAGFVETLEKAAMKMGTESAPTMDQQMTQVMNSFIRMKEMGLTSKQAAERTAELFSLAEATVEAKIQNWIRVIPPKADGTERPEKKQARQVLSWYQSGQADTSSLNGRMGAFYNGAVPEWTKANQGTKTTLQDRLEKEAERAKEAFNRANPYTSYNDIYGTKETTPSGHKYPAGFNQSGTTREQLEKRLSVGIDGLKTTSTGAWDYSSILNRYSGGQISEPVFGIGMSGRAYSFGEHGAETITPNGQMGGGGGITINIAKIDKTADFEQLKPMIQKWILEANSRRGII